MVGKEVKVQGMTRPATLNEDGLYCYGNDGKKVQQILKPKFQILSDVIYPPSLHHPSSTIPLSQLLITQLQLSDGQMVRAHMFGQTEKQEKLVLTEEEEAMVEKVRASWSAILSLSNIDENTDFFKSGAGSMDVTR